ncbi:chromate transporter [Larkinella soli]|uniref:chromate transporter n=1 Tax=Larkinella soli TaxID=1770527 RepID=UPI000FFB0E2B|nr:chromate transporter [Larkinella soli]
MSQAILEPELAPYFTEKAPFQIPVNIREGFVKYWPIVSLVFLILAIPAILLFLGLGTALLPASFLGGMGTGFIYTITMVLSIAGFVLSVAALPGLFNRRRQGWVLSYYAQLISLATSILGISILGIFFGLLWLLLLFQVRSYYN